MKICVVRRACRTGELAEKYGLGERELMALNGLERPCLLPRGMSLVLGGGAAAREGELYCTWERGAGQCPERLSFAAAELGTEDEAGRAGDFPGFAAGHGALPVYSLRAQGDAPETRALICQREQGAEFIDRLTDKIAEGGYGALGLDIPWLLPFDRGNFTDFAAASAEAAHKKGLWLICTVPLYSEESRYQRRCAAYDAAALGQLADRLIADAGGLMGAAELGRGLEYICSLVPAGRLLAGIYPGAWLYREGEREALSIRSAQSIAISAGAEISRRAAGAEAEFRFRDKAGELCRVAYGDCLWAEGICALVGRLSLAGLARRCGQRPVCGTERVLDGGFQVQEVC